jgi:hypothetical protein
MPNTLSLAYDEELLRSRLMRLNVNIGGRLPRDAIVLRAAPEAPHLKARRRRSTGGQHSGTIVGSVPRHIGRAFHRRPAKTGCVLLPTSPMRHYFVDFDVVCRVHVK